VLASAAAHLAKGLDVEEAAGSLLLLAALLRYRSQFDVPGRVLDARPAVVTAVAALGLPLGLVVSLPDRVADVFVAVGVLAGFVALHLWLRPLTEAVVSTVAGRRAAHALVAEYGRDSLSFFALRRDKSLFFSPSGRAFLAYRVVGGTAIVSGDPVGDERELDALISEFRRVVHAAGWRFAVVGVAAKNVARYGMRAIPMGDEAVLIPARFSLDGRAIRKVRQSVTRLRAAGYTFRVVDAETADRGQIDAISAEWRGGDPERGFSMAMDDLYAPGTVLALAVGPDGRIGGFLHLAPSPAQQGWSLSTMRRRGDTPNGLNEFLIAETAAWARDQGASELSLNFCALTDFLSPERPVLRRIVLAGDRVFQLERLHSFSRKFHPEWRRRFVCVEKLSDLPLVGLAYLHLEQLLVPPRRSVSHST
jgi:lysyl-tRNA synthetase class 2